MIQECPGGVSAPKEFFSSGVHAGVKKVKKDLALVYSARPATAGGVFTTNKVPAAPVLVDLRTCQRGMLEPHRRVAADLSPHLRSGVDRRLRVVARHRVHAAV